MDQECLQIGSDEVADDGIVEGSFQNQETVKMNRNRGAICLTQVKDVKF